MKTVIILRHGKSDWSSEAAQDHDRPLAPRGEKAAKLMGRFLKESGEAPDSIVTSSAVRARSTAELAMKAGKWDCEKRVSEKLYNCSPSDMLREIKAEPDTTGILLLVGHEPTCSETVTRLGGPGRMRFATAAMARLDLPIDHWQDADFGNAQLIWMVTPKLVEKLLGE